MDTIWLAAQAVGFLSMGIGWWANAQRSDSRLCQGNLAAAVITACHFLLLGSPLGAMNQVISAARFGVTRTRFAGHQGLMVVLCLAAVTQGLWLAESWADGWAVAGAIIATLALFRCQGDQLRVGLLVANLCNLAFSVHLMSLSGIGYQTVTLILLIRQLLVDNRQTA